MKLTRRLFSASAAAAVTGVGRAQIAPSWTAIQGVCAWPNLQRLSDGTLVATIFNQPCHGEWEGDLDCYASKDDGKTWKFHGRPGPHDPRTNRMNCGAGVAGNGDMVVLVSGWSNRESIGNPTSALKGQVLTQIAQLERKREELETAIAALRETHNRMTGAGRAATAA